MFRRFLLATFGAMLALAAPSAASAAATVGIAVSSDPRVDVAFTLTVSGSSTSSGRSVIVGSTVGSTCPAWAGSTSMLGSLQGIGTGSFTKTFTDTLTGPNAQTRRYCAYVTTGAYDNPDATATTVVTARRANATAAIDVSADPRVDIPFTLTVTGTAENAGRSVIVGSTVGSTCPAWAGSTSMLGSLQGIGTGSFTKTFTDTLTGPNAQTRRYCAYVTTGAYDNPDATATTVVKAIDPNQPAPAPTRSDDTNNSPVVRDDNRRAQPKPAGEELDEAAAENALLAALPRRYGEAYDASDDDTWVRCPDDQANADDEGVERWLCEFRFRDREEGKWRHALAEISRDLNGTIALKVFSSVVFTKTLKTCKIRRHLRIGYRPQILSRTLQADGYVGCSDAGMIRDLNNAKPGIRRVGFHGTNQAGFEDTNTFRCKVTSRGARRTARCANELGNRFVYSWTVRTVKPKPKPKPKPSPSSPSPSSGSSPSTGSTPTGTCSDTTARNFPVPAGDPRDGDGDGIACET